MAKILSGGYKTNISLPLPGGGRVNINEQSDTTDTVARDTETRERIKMKLADEKKAKTMAQESLQMGKNIQLMRTYSKQIGAPGRIGGLMVRAGMFAGMQPAAKTFDGLTGAIKTQVSKKLAGESGRLTDQDIERISGMVPDIGDTPEERELKLTTIEMLADPKMTADQANEALSAKFIDLLGLQTKTGNAKHYKIKGIDYYIPFDKISEFEKEMGIK